MLHWLSLEHEHSPELQLSPQRPAVHSAPDMHGPEQEPGFAKLSASIQTGSASVQSTPVSQAEHRPYELQRLLAHWLSVVHISPFVSLTVQLPALQK
jgi:hypothetical protein